jgi:hypothetical protein
MLARKSHKPKNIKAKRRTKIMSEWRRERAIRLDGEIVPARAGEARAALLEAALKEAEERGRREENEACAKIARSHRNDDCLVKSHLGCVVDVENEIRARRNKK